MKKFYAVFAAVTMIAALVAGPATQAQQPALFPQAVYSPHTLNVSNTILPGMTVTQDVVIPLTRWDEVALQATVAQPSTNTAALTLKFAKGTAAAGPFESTESIAWVIPPTTGTAISITNTTGSGSNAVTNVFSAVVSTVVTDINVGAVGYLNLTTIANALAQSTNGSCTGGVVSLSWTPKPRRHGEQ